VEDGEGEALVLGRPLLDAGREAVLFRSFYEDVAVSTLGLKLATLILSIFFLFHQAVSRGGIVRGALTEGIPGLLGSEVGHVPEPVVGLKRHRD